MKWFKFYGQDFLTDTKIIGMDPLLRQIYITMLCLCNDDGVINDLREYDLVKMAGCEDDQFSNPSDYSRTKDCIEYFKEKKMITVTESNEGNVLRGVTYNIKIVNYERRQEVSLTNAERQQRFREKHKNEAKVTESNEKVTLDKNRIDKNNTKAGVSNPFGSTTYLKELPLEDLTNFNLTYNATKAQIQDEAQQIILYCESKGRKYSNYRSTLQSWLLRKYGKRSNNGYIKRYEN